MFASPLVRLRVTSDSHLGPRSGDTKFTQGKCERDAISGYLNQRKRLQLSLEFEEGHCAVAAEGRTGLKLPCPFKCSFLQRIGKLSFRSPEDFFCYIRHGRGCEPVRSR